LTQEQPMESAEMAAPESATPRIFDLDPKAVAKSDPAAAPTSDPNAISFTKTVAPILSNRCGGCHINGSKGGFSLATFAALMKGPPEGVVIFAGDTIGSRLIETIETGDMPRGGGKVSPAELATLKAWIMTGAKFDGTDPEASITAGTGPAPAMTANAARPEVRRATGNETVSFAADIAPILVENCKGCHIDAMQIRGGLNMTNFAGLFRGGDSGAVVEPGKSAASLIVKKIRGMEGDRMPAGGRPALPEEKIQLISKWIDEGATLDGASENQPLSVMSQLAWAASASNEQLSDRRRELAADSLKLANASGAPILKKTTEHFYLVGTASEATLDVVAKAAEDQMKMVKSVVSGDKGEGFYHGRATIFVLPRRYDYSEFSKMVEARSVPSDWSSHWKFNGIDAYVSMVATDRDDEDVIAARLLSPLTGLAVATRGGDVPRWLAEGVATATASRTKGLDRAERQKIESEISQAISAMGDAKKFLTGKLTPEQSDRIGAAIATSLLDRTHRRNFDRCMKFLSEGASFNQAFQQSFGATPTAFVDAWMKWVRG
ncbi:MAG: c-type cytochrome domain-containing protein, partial [Rubripirellula sp.]